MRSPWLPLCVAAGLFASSAWRRAPDRRGAVALARAPPPRAEPPRADEAEPYFEVELDLLARPEVRAFLARQGVAAHDRAALANYVPGRMLLRVWPARVRGAIGEAALGGWLAFALQNRPADGTLDDVCYVVVVELARGVVSAVLPTGAELSFDALKVRFRERPFRNVPFPPENALALSLSLLARRARARARVLARARLTRAAIATRALSTALRPVAPAARRQRERDRERPDVPVALRRRGGGGARGRRVARAQRVVDAARARARALGQRARRAVGDARRRRRVLAAGRGRREPAPRRRGERRRAALVGGRAAVARRRAADLQPRDGRRERHGLRARPPRARRGRR